MPFRMLGPILRLSVERPRPVALVLKRYLRKGLSSNGPTSAESELDDKQRRIESEQTDKQKDKQRMELKRKAARKFNANIFSVTELNERIQQTQSAELSADEELKFRLENVLANSDTESVARFLAAIRFKPNELQPSQLDIIFCLMCQLIFELNAKKAMSIDDSVRVLEHSEAFAAILARSMQIVDRAYPNCLLSVLEMLTMIKAEPGSELVRRVLTALNGHLNQLNVNQLCRCYKAASQYLLFKIPETQQLIDLKQSVLQREKRMLLRNQFDSKDEDSVIEYMENFADFEVDPNFQVVEHLAKVLLQPFVSLNFKQAVKIMAKIQPSDNFYRFKRKSGRRLHPELAQRYREKRLHPPILSDLFDKCNATIFEEFTFNLSAETFPYFLTKLHTSVSALNYEFPNFYDQRLLAIIRPWLIWNHQYRALDYNLLLRMVRNYSHFYVYDEELLRVVYEKFCSTMSFKKFDAMTFYGLLAKFRWPFVDHSNANLLARVRNSIESRTNSVRLLATLLLNDVCDDELLGYLNERINSADDALFRNLKMDDYKPIVLARNYLSMFSPLDGRLRVKLEHKLEQIIHRMLVTRQRPEMSFKYFRIDNRLSNTAYLSNGIFVDVFAIYDKSTGDLVSLNEHRESLGPSFARIDQLQLSRQQEL